MIPGYLGDMPGMHVQEQQTTQVLCGGVEYMQGAHQPVQIHDRVRVERHGIGRARRYAGTARAEGVELGLIAEHRAGGIQHGIEGAFQAHAVKSRYHDPFLQGKGCAPGVLSNALKMLVKVGDPLRERHRYLPKGWRGASS